MRDKGNGMCGFYLGGAVCSLAVATVIVFAPSGARAQSVTYGYDALGRLTTANYPNGATITYTYDAAGNRTQVTNAATPPPPLAATVSASSWTRTPSNTPAAITCTGSGGVAPYSYRWIYVSGDTLTELVDEFSNSGTWFRPVPTSTARTSTWRCRVTDSTTTTANSSNVAVSIRTN